MKKFLLVILFLWAWFLSAQNPATHSKVTCPLYKIDESSPPPTPTTGLFYREGDELYWDGSSIISWQTTDDDNLVLKDVENNVYIGYPPPIIVTHSGYVSSDNSSGIYTYRGKYNNANYYRSRDNSNWYIWFQPKTSPTEYDMWIISRVLGNTSENNRWVTDDDINTPIGDVHTPPIGSDWVGCDDCVGSVITSQEPWGVDKLEVNGSTKSLTFNATSSLVDLRDDGLFIEGEGGESSILKDGDTLFYYLAVAGEAGYDHINLYYTTDVRGIGHFTPYSGNPVLTGVVYPNAIRYSDGVIYLFGCKSDINSSGQSSVYVWRSLDKRHFTPAKNGEAVLTNSTDPSSIYNTLYNTGACFVNDTIHMLIECYDPSIGMGCTYSWSKLSDMDFDTHATTHHVMDLVCPTLEYVPDRKALISIASKYESRATNRAVTVSLYDDLTNRDSWILSGGFKMSSPYIIYADPVMVATGSSTEYKIIFLYNYAQGTLGQKHLNMTLNEFYDKLRSDRGALVVNNNTMIDNLNAEFLGGNYAPYTQIVGIEDYQTIKHKTFTDNIITASIDTTSTNVPMGLNAGGYPVLLPTLRINPDTNIVMVDDSRTMILGTERFVLGDELWVHDSIDITTNHVTIDGTKVTFTPGTGGAAAFIPWSLEIGKRYVAKFKVTNYVDGVLRIDNGCSPISIYGTRSSDGWDSIVFRPNCTTSNNQIPFVFRDLEDYADFTIDSITVKEVLPHTEKLMVGGKISILDAPIIGYDPGYRVTLDDSGFVRKIANGAWNDNRIGLLDGAIDAGSTIYCYGNSITNGIGATPNTNGYSYLVADVKNMTRVGRATNGYSLADIIQYNIYPYTTLSNQKSLGLLGYNDMTQYGTNATFLNCFRRQIYSAAIWLSVPTSQLKLGQDLSTSGTWLNVTKFGLAGVTIRSNSNGATATAYVTGTTVYIDIIQSNGESRGINVNIDGDDYGTYEGSDFTNTRNSVSTFAPYCIRIPNLEDKPHEVVLTVTTGTGYAYVNWVAGNSVEYNEDPSEFYLGNCLKMNAAGYATAQGGSPGAGSDEAVLLINNIIKKCASDLYNDGLNVVYVDANSYYDITDCVDSDNIHPNNLGHQRLAEAFLYKMNGLTKYRCTNIREILKLSPTTAPPSPEEGDVYAGTDHHLYYWNGSSWLQLDNSP